METRSRMSRSLHTNRDFEKLEPYEGKPSRTVLRGEEGSNALDLPDQTFGRLWGMKPENLRSAYNKGMDQPRSNAFIQRVNRALEE